MAMQGNELTERQRPYASPANVIAVLHRVRSRNLPERIDDDLLRLAQVPEGARHRVHAALRFLGLVDEDGRPSEDLRALASATDEEYPTHLERFVRRAYAEDFERIDPARDSQAQIVSAFRPYQPRSQTNRMVILLLGLCREAGIEVLDAPRERQQAPRLRAPVTPRGRRSAAREPKEERGGGSAREGTLFGVSEEDIDVLSESEFEELWTALGKVARARARAKRQPPEAGAETGEDRGDSEGGGR
jgi:hypothetical protein